MLEKNSIINRLTANAISQQNGYSQDQNESEKRERNL